MKFSGNWLLVTTPPIVRNGLYVSAKDPNTLCIRDLATGERKDVSRYEIGVTYKYRCEVLFFLTTQINSMAIENLFIDIEAAKIVDKVCESGRLLS